MLGRNLASLPQAKLTFYQLYSRQKLPVLAKQYAADIPKRARNYCPPFRSGLTEGFYFFSPISFDFYLERDVLRLRTEKTGGEWVTVTSPKSLPKQHFLDIGQVDPTGLENAIHLYKKLTQGQSLPTQTLKVPMRLLAIGWEEDPFGPFIQIWLGGIIQLAAGQKLLIKNPTNLLLNRGFEVLDGIVESDRWMGWFSVVIRPCKQDQWVHIDAQVPLCQGLIYQFHDHQLTTALDGDVPQEVYMNLLNWHAFDPNYGKVPGKYQRELQKHDQWNCQRPQ